MVTTIEQRRKFTIIKTPKKSSDNVVIVKEGKKSGSGKSTTFIAPAGQTPDVREGGQNETVQNKPNSDAGLTFDKILEANKKQTVTDLEPQKNDVSFNQILQANKQQTITDLNPTKRQVTFQELVNANAKEKEKNVFQKIGALDERIGQTLRDKTSFLRDGRNPGIATSESIIQDAKKKEAKAKEQLKTADFGEGLFRQAQIVQAKSTIASQSYIKSIEDEFSKKPVTNTALFVASAGVGAGFQASKFAFAATGIKAGSKFSKVGSFGSKASSFVTNKNTLTAVGAASAGSIIAFTPGGLQEKSSALGSATAQGAIISGGLLAGSKTTSSAINFGRKIVTQQRAINTFQVRKAGLAEQQTPKGLQTKFAVESKAIINNKPVNIKSFGGTRTTFDKTRGKIITTSSTDKPFSTVSVATLEAGKFQKGIVGDIFVKDILGKDIGNFKFVSSQKKTDIGFTSKSIISDIRTPQKGIFTGSVGKRIPSKVSDVRLFEIKSKGVGLDKPFDPRAGGGKSINVDPFQGIVGKKGQISISESVGKSRGRNIREPSLSGVDSAIGLQKSFVRNEALLNFKPVTSLKPTTAFGVGTGAASFVGGNVIKSGLSNRFSKDNFFKESFSISPKEDSIFKFNTRPRSYDTGIKSSFDFKLDKKQSFDFKLDTKPPGTPVFDFGITQPIPNPSSPGIPPPIPPFLLPLGGGSQSITGKTKPKGRKTRSTGSLLAAEFNIKGKRQTKFTGLEIRPIF